MRSGRKPKENTTPTSDKRKPTKKLPVHIVGTSSGTTTTTTPTSVGTAEKSDTIKGYEEDDLCEGCGRDQDDCECD
jgi:hypothetical protein